MRPFYYTMEQPTYSVKEIEIEIDQTDLNGLKQISDIVNRERPLYRPKDYNKIMDMIAEKETKETIL